MGLKSQKKVSSALLSLSRSVQELTEENQSLKEDLDHVLSNSPTASRIKGIFLRATRGEDTCRGHSSCSLREDAGRWPQESHGPSPLQPSRPCFICCKCRCTVLGHAPQDALRVQ